MKRFISVYENDTWADAHCDWVDEREDSVLEAMRRHQALSGARRGFRTAMSSTPTINPHGAPASGYPDVAEVKSRRLSIDHFI